ncbi:hypothetical protein F7725_023822 [Dissostichus mawsoni]|uniref:Uncharacterized protein n=1 Tax=Dissostichus mawsoni TaxID=36200 RepID=A0A7J5XYC3_DISMA|nr:hypothetical protein F7725_023822 [Dissostichus mawsoni]
MSHVVPLLLHLFQLCLRQMKLGLHALVFLGQVVLLLLSWFWARSLESFFFCSSNWFSNCLTSVSLRWTNCSQFSCFSARSLENFSSCSLICSFSCLTSVSQLRLFSARRSFSFSTCFNLASTCLNSVSKCCLHLLLLSLPGESIFGQALGELFLALKELFLSSLQQLLLLCLIPCHRVFQLLFVLKLCSFHLLLQIAVSILQDCHTLKEFFPFSYQLFHGLPFPHPQFDDLWVTLQGNIIVLAVRCRLVLLV